MTTQQQGTGGPQVRQETEAKRPTRQREQAGQTPDGASRQQAGSEGGSRQMGGTRITDWASI